MIDHDAMRKRQLVISSIKEHGESILEEVEYGDEEIARGMIALADEISAADSRKYLRLINAIGAGTFLMLFAVLGWLILSK